MTPHSSGLDKVEVVQHRVGRLAVEGNRWAAVEAIMGEAEWSSSEERLERAILTYKNQA